MEGCCWPGLWHGRREQREGRRLPRRETWRMRQKEPPPAGVRKPVGMGSEAQGASGWGAASPGCPLAREDGTRWPLGSLLMMDKDVRSLSHRRPEPIISF